MEPVSTEPKRKGRKGSLENPEVIENVPGHVIPILEREFDDFDNEAGLSSREGCGNTVRNVTGDPWAGVCEGELFDPTPYAGAYVRYFVRHPTTQGMPRKVKTAFTATDEDRAINGIHDVAYIPRVRDGRRGFEMVVGGGTSIMPRVAQTLYEFVSADDGEYLRHTEAVLRIFDRQEWLRVNRARARIKVFVDKYGIDELRRQTEEELQGDWVAERDFSVSDRAFDHDEEANAPVPAASYAGPNGDVSDFERFRRSNVQAQRQSGYAAVEVAVTRGDLSPEQFRGLAAIMREYSGGYARTTVGQNLVLRWIRDEAVYEVWQRLKALDLGEPGAQEITDVVSCPGTDSCKLGITSSMGLNLAIREKLAELQITDELTKQIQIKMSGCPNGCGQHHIGHIGFYGASIKVGENTLPAYVAHVGGRHPDGRVKFGA